VDLFLDLGVKILHTKADTGKAMLFEYFHLIFIEKSWIDLYTDLCLWAPVGDLLFDIGDDLIEFKIFVVGRRSSSEVELDQFTAGIEMLDEDIDLFFEVDDVVAEFALFGGEDHVTSTKITGTSTKGQVDIDRDLLSAVL